MRILSSVLALLVLFAGGFATYEHQRVSALETRLEIFQTYHFKIVADRAKESPTGYQFSQLVEKVDLTAGGLAKVTQDIKKIHPGGFLNPGDLAEGVDQWSVFVARIYDAEQLQKRGDSDRARTIALGAFEGLGIFCHSRRLPVESVRNVRPLVEDLYVFRPDDRQSDWIVVAGNHGC